MSTFDERYQMLEQALQNALNRLDQFVEQEASLKDALEKLNADLDSKMDSDAEKKLKRFMGRESFTSLKTESSEKFVPFRWKFWLSNKEVISEFISPSRVVMKALYGLCNLRNGLFSDW